MVKGTETLRSRLLDHPESTSVLLLDGGTSTNLETILQSKPSPQTPQFPDRNLWSSSLLLSPEGLKDIQKCHEDFYNAGSDIVTTVTYQLSHYACRFGFEESVIDGLFYEALSIARAAADAVSARDLENMKGAGVVERSVGEETRIRERYVIASLGCYGAVLADGSEYTGAYGKKMSMQELTHFHTKRIQIFLELERQRNADCIDNVDGFAFETIPCLQEVKAIVQTMISIKLSHQFVWLSLACRDESTLNDGTPIMDVLQTINDLDSEGVIHGIGVNCCKVKYIHKLSRSIARHIISSRCANNRRVIVLYPNSGEEWVAENETWLEGSGCTNAEDYAKEMLRCIQSIHDMCDEKGVPRLSILAGGCCRTSPLMIKALREQVDGYVSTSMRRSVSGDAL